MGNTIDAPGLLFSPIDKEYEFILDVKLNSLTNKLGLKKGH